MFPWAAILNIFQLFDYYRGAQFSLGKKNIYVYFLWHLEIKLPLWSTLTSEVLRMSQEREVQEVSRSSSKLYSYPTEGNSSGYKAAN